MTAPLSGQFSKPKVKGMMGGPRATKGRDGSGDLSAVSGKPLPGTTRGNLSAAWFWNQYPYLIGGLTEYDPNATMPGSNLQSLGASEVEQEAKVGGGASQAQIPDYGGTSY
jgi:hypothetical protein